MLVLQSGKGGIISLIVITILDAVYTKLAQWLTEYEVPKTDNNYYISFATKVFMFRFVNFYSYLFYIAFFKQTFAGHPRK